MRLCYVCTEDPDLGARLSELISGAGSDWTCTVFPDAASIRESLIRTKPDMLLVDAARSSPGLMREIRLLADSAWTILVGGDASTDLPRLPVEFQPSDLAYFLDNPPESFRTEGTLSIRREDMVTNILLGHIWTGLLNHWLRPERTMIRMAAQGVGLPGLEHMHVLPILVKTIHRQKIETTREQSSLDHIFFENLLERRLLGNTHQGAVLDRFEQKWAVLLYIEDTPIPEGALRERCQQAMEVALEQGWQLSFVLGAPVLPEALPGQWIRLEELAQNDVGCRTSIRTLQDTQQSPEALELPDMQAWHRLLDAGEFQAVSASVSGCIQALAAERELTTQWLLQFRNAFVEEIYRAIHVHGIPIGAVFQSDVENSAFARSGTSIRQLLAWIQTVLAAMDRFRQDSAPDTVVQQAQKYILQHLDQDLSREEIARNVYVSCGYLGRLFKKELHMNMSEYIFSERMKVAQQMLEQTDLYVTTIAMNVGYSNFPYFSTQFKQYSGCSPMEYRKRRRSQHTAG